MESRALELDMARRSFGFGRWDAPYWFIGPEQGKGKDEPDNNAQRVKAWLQLGGAELCDCLEFHDRISDMSWHSGKPNLQPTWRPLILLLKTFLDEPSDIESIRAYQRDLWGRVTGGKTCLIELSGVAARSSKVPVDRGSFLQERIEVIRERMLSYRPTFVVMFGASEEPNWEKIAGRPLIRDGVVRVGSTTIVFAPHPQDRGRRNADWVNLGEKMRLESGQL